MSASRFRLSISIDFCKRKGLYKNTTLVVTVDSLEIECMLMQHNLQGLGCLGMYLV